jgi:hypothetical protein
MYHMYLTLYTAITLTSRHLDLVINSPQQYTATQRPYLNMSCDAWLALHASHYSERDRTSLQLVLNFLEISELNDLLAIDEQALNYACTHKPSLGAAGFFKIADVCRLRQVLSSSNFPNFRHPKSASTTKRKDEFQSSIVHPTPDLSDSHSRLRCPTITVSQPAANLIAQHIFTNAVAPSVTLVPLDTADPPPPDHSFLPTFGASKALFISPVAQRTPRYSEWTLVRTIDLTERLNAHLGADRQYYNGGDYYMNEWPVVIKLLWPHICDDTAFDCFWNWHDPTPVPVRLFWHKSATSYPPIGSAPFGVEYACDFETVSGCPKKMKVLRSRASVSIFELHLRSLPARHGCIHTLSKDKCSSTARTGEVPSLHPGLKAFIRRQSFNHDSSSNLTWGNISEKAASYILKTTFLHCQLPHLPPSSSTLRDHRTQCQHPRTLSMLRRDAAYSCLPDMITDPATEEIPTNKPGSTKRQYSNVACSVAPLLLEDGHTLLGCHEFSQPVAEQCREYLRSCNNRFHGQLDGPENSSLDIMHADFTKHNLYVDFINAMCNHGRLDLFRFNVIGYCYSLDPPDASRNTTHRESTNRRLYYNLYHLGFYLHFFPDPIYFLIFLYWLHSYNFYCVYASFASLLTHVSAAWKATVMGWMNYNMDVVHELGSLVHNLNIFNVAVTDAKQVAHLVSCTIHLGRKGHVYEGTSACIMAASR